MKQIPLFIYCFLLAATSLFAEQKPIDTNRSTITLHVGKAGLFSAAGHDHLVAAPIAEGVIDDSEPAHIWFRIEAAKLTVLPEEHQIEIQSTMQNRVLESNSFPEIRFESNAVEKLGDQRWAVSGTLSLHGKRNPIKVDVKRANGGYLGRVVIRQTAFGIQPVSVAGGSVRVKDELEVEFTVVSKQ